VLIILACAISANVQAQLTDKVEINDVSFQPDVIYIPLGTTVTWTNEGTTDHTVTGDNSEFHSGYIAPGGQFSLLFDNPGDYPYHCNIYPFMRGIIHVVPKQYPASANVPNAYPQYSQYYQAQTISGTTLGTHITNPQEYDIQSNSPAYLYFRDQEQPVPYYQYQTYAAQEGGNFLWVQEPSSWSQYATVPQGTLVSLIATTLTGGNGYLYETYPDGHTIKNYYYFFPYSQIGLNADTIGQHKLSFSIDDQMSNSIVIDVTGSGSLSNVQPENQQPNYPQSNYNSFLEASMVKLDSNGQLTVDGIQGTDYNLYPSNTNILTRGLLYNGISYILVANPNSASDTVTVDPGINNWNMQSAIVKYGNLMIAKANNLLQITIPAHQSGLIVVQPQKKRYSFSVGPKPAYSFSAGQKPAYSFSAGPKPAYSFKAGPTPQYSFRAGY